MVESPIKDLPSIGHLPLLSIGFGVHTFSFDVLDLPTTAPLSVFASFICVLYFLFLTLIPLLKCDFFFLNRFFDRPVLTASM